MAERYADARACAGRGRGRCCVAAGVAVAVADPFAGSSPAASGVADNAAATVAGDGEAAGSVAADAGERDARLCRYLDGVGAERDGAGRASSSRSSRWHRRSRRSAADERALAQAQASLDADLRKVAVDCRGGNAAESGGGSQQGGGGAPARARPTRRR